MHSRNWKRAGSLALIALGVSALSVATAQAQVSGLYNTGVDLTGVSDNAWSIIGGTGTGVGATPYNAYANSAGTGYPGGPWVPNSAISQWDTPTNPFTGSLDPSVNGTYIYETKFTVTGAVPSALNFQFAADNEVSSITLNGNTIYTGPIDGSSQYGFWTPVTASGLIDGLNTLDFTVVNYAQSGNGNPSGLNVEFAPGPVPGAGLAGLAALALAGLYARTRRA
jgi:hypothetical protein